MNVGVSQSSREKIEYVSRRLVLVYDFRTDSELCLSEMPKVISRGRGHSFNQISKKMKLKALLLVKLIATLVSIIIFIELWPMKKGD